MYLKQNNPHGGDIYSRNVSLDFSSNINPAGMPEEVKQAVRDSAENCRIYPDPFCRQLRQGISRMEGVPVDHIICGNGASDLIYAYAYSLSGDEPALIVSPTFSDYRASLDAAGIPVENYILKEEDGFRLTENILRQDLARFCAVYICTPNNPTGICAEPELIRKLAGTGVRLFLDMCFLDLTEDPERYDIQSLTSDHPNVTVLRAFTKNYAMAGVRLGYAMSSDEELLETMSSKTPCWNVSSVAQAAGCAALECGEWLKRSVTEIAAERSRLGKELGSLGVEVWPGEANYLMLRTEKDLYGSMLEHGILIRDCSNYDGLGNGYYRIAVRSTGENDIFLKAAREVLG